MPVVTGSPVGPFVDALLARLTSDATVMGLATGGIYTSLPIRTRTAPPYVVLGRQELGPSDAGMQREGGQVTVTIDTWSGQNSPAEVRSIQARIRVLLQRADLSIAGFALVLGSVTCEEELVFQDTDPDIPERQLFHGVQRWTAWVEESL